MSKILVLVGPPASGKSTFARNFIKENHHWVIVNRDSIRDGLGDYWVPEREELVSRIERNNILNAIDMGWNVIIDATNLNKKTIAKWEALADEKQCEIEYKEFWIPFHEAIERDQNEDRTHQVGFKVIRDFYQKYNPELLNSKEWDYRYIKKQDFTLPNVVICDIDGTLALRRGRSPYNYEKCNTDEVNDPLLTVLWQLKQQGNKIIFFSGREKIGKCEEKTMDWLNENFGPYDDLIMREENDHRPDDIVKEEFYKKYIEGKYCVTCVFDDRDKVVAKWRDLGLLCCQVYYGDF